MSGFKYRRLDKTDAAVLLVDHQSGLCNIVGDFSPDDFKNSVLALADLAKYFQLPTILTTSFESGPNGPLVPELKAMFPEAPYIAAGEHQCVGQRRLREGGEGDGEEAADHRGGGDGGVCRVSGAVGAGGRL